MNKSVSVVLLAKKEEENLKVLLPRIHSVIKDMGVEYEIIVIDSQIPLDGSEKVCRELGAKYFPQEWPGFGGAYKTGIKYAGLELLLALDCDGSHRPEQIPDLYNKYMEGYDLVLGSRYIKGGVTNDKRISIIMSKILNFIFRIVTGFKAKELSTNFRLYTTSALKEIDLENRNFDVMQELLLRLKLNDKNLKFAEVPIIFEKRIYGESKRQLFKFILSYIKTVFKLLKLRITYKKKEKA